MLGRLAPVAAQRAWRSETTAPQVVDGAPITAADWAFYTEKVRIASTTWIPRRCVHASRRNEFYVGGVFFAANQVYGSPLRA
jgi:peptidyl-dipeptidase Dcp